MHSKLKIASLISGGGSTNHRIIQECKSGILQEKVKVALVIASKPGIKGIQRAIDEGISPKDVVVINPKDFQNSTDFGKAILNECHVRKVDFIGQYGWMPKTPPNVIEAYSGMMVNQHPGPIDPGRPDFGGRGMHGRRVNCARLLFVRMVGRDFWTEAIAQRVAKEYDQGKLLNKIVVPIFPEDDPISLQERVLPLEHQVQIKTLEMVADDDVKELNRPEPLIRPGEEKILEKAKRIACMLFPEG